MSLNGVENGERYKQEEWALRNEANGKDDQLVTLELRLKIKVELRAIEPDSEDTLVIKVLMIIIGYSLRHFDFIKCKISRVYTIDQFKILTRCFTAPLEWTVQ